MPTSRRPVPAFLRGLVADAAARPPGEASIDEAVHTHLAHRGSDHADLLGALVVGDGDLPRVADLVAASPPPAPLAVAVVVSGGAGALAPAVHWATRSEHLDLVAVEIAVRESDAGDPAPNARRIVAAVDGLLAEGVLGEDVAVHVAPPRLYAAEPSASWLRALDEVAAMDHRLTLRTAGVHAADPAPSAAELARCIGAALDRELAFACGAGPHRAVRHRDDATGLELHGFLNVLLATRASLDGAGPADVATVLEERDAEVLMGSADDAALASARRWLTTVGASSVASAVRDLAAVGLLEAS